MTNPEINRQKDAALDAVASVKAAARDVLASADAMMLVQWTPPEFLRVCEVLGASLGIRREDWSLAAPFGNKP